MKQCPQCRNTYPDDIEFCMHEGARLVPEGTPFPAQPPPAKKKRSKVLLGCLIALAAAFGSCVVGIGFVMNSPEFKKQEAEAAARREKESQESAERLKQDAVTARKMIAALRSNFPSLNSRREMTCTIAEVEKALGKEAGESRHRAGAFYVDRDFLARFSSNAPPANDQLPGWDWLTSAGLRDWSPEKGYTVTSRDDLRHSYIVVIQNQGVQTPQIRDQDFVGGEFRGWAALFDSDTQTVLGQTEIRVRSSDKVKYKKERFTANREGMEEAVQEDFRDQFKESLEKSMERMCPKLSLDASLP